ncbi:hypothetical protein ANASTE_01574 [Anaerofustis stercorihominis DSM 17244]|uniref:Uncharacterized protein n=1 Tax=Anaerofustis stercorihominis DSM 17244 TaxID=445971 RepID=B1CC74_9FIRM|nr:hypothetical protein [Anaerofustis stercorihominis]EDS71871.1 hypothetical protein ANASTE_01574 [Anaerofustis stercorihominis DSM 17244]
MVKKDISKLYYKVISIFKDDKLIDIKEETLLSYSHYKSTYQRKDDKEIFKDYFSNRLEAYGFVHDLKYGIEDD